ncbi:nucleic acid-binding domain protein [Bacteroidales bacterium KA00344]|nr:nucleic acid-binding domain protein [Bacteroidales bacterium KA00344]
MKLRYILPSFVAAMAMLAGCSDADYSYRLNNVQLSSSYVSIPEDGGTTNITMNVTDSWSIDTTGVSKWLTVSPVKGEAGDSIKVSFTAPATLDGRTADLLLTCGGNVQHINVIQGLPKISPATCKEVIEGPEKKTYMVTGICTAITNTKYGNWYLKDATGSIYIYGTLDKDGKEENFTSWGLEVGDEITVQGPKEIHKSTIELKNVTVLNINKSLIKVDSVENDTLPVEGGEFVSYLTCKGQGVSVEVPEKAKSWLSISSIHSAGTNTVVKFRAAANVGGDRSTKIVFHTTDGSKNYTSETTLCQLGAIVPATVAEFLAAETGETQYRVSGVIESIKSAKYGNFYIKDYSGSVYVYGLADFTAKGYKEGDVVTLVGKRGEYKSNAQMLGAVAEKHVVVTKASIADVLTKKDDSKTYYMVTGQVTSIDNASYGNVHIKDGDTEMCVYGCYPTFGAQGEARKGLVKAVGLKVGDILSVIGTKSSHNGSPQLSNGVYAGHKSR